MRKILLLLILFLMFTLFAEDKTEKEDQEKVQAIDQERKEILLYGIDMEIKELITTLSKDEITGFDKELLILLESTFDNDLKILVFEYFIKMEVPDGEDEALKIFDLIEYEDEYSDKYAAVAIKYLSEIRSKKAITRAPGLLESENKTVLISVLKLIGENEDISQEDILITMLEDDETDDIVYLEVIKTLGKIKSTKSLENLIEIADDEDEETTVRNAICFSLGEIGDVEAIPVLKRCLADRKNFLLRKSALEALSKFPSLAMNDILIESLRDPHWQIRYTACKSLGERKVEKAFPNLRYKALKDPEDKINKVAFEAIGDIDSSECRDFLKEVYTQKSYTERQKTYAIEKLIEHNVDWIFPTIEEMYTDKNMDKRKTLLDTTLKLLSKREYKYASDLFGKMLTHENYIYRLLAISGIRLNKYKEHKEIIEELSTSDENRNVKKHALSTLEEL